MDRVSFENRRQCFRIGAPANISLTFDWVEKAGRDPLAAISELATNVRIGLVFRSLFRRRSFAQFRKTRSTSYRVRTNSSKRLNYLSGHAVPCSRIGERESIARTRAPPIEDPIDERGSGDREKQKGARDKSVGKEDKDRRSGMAARGEEKLGPLHERRE